MALHGEDSAISLRSRLHAAREMGGVIRETQIIDQIPAWHDGKAGIQQHRSPENAFIKLLSTMGMIPAHRDEVLTEPTLANHRFQLSHRLLIAQKGIVTLPFVHHTAPRSPSPDREDRSKEIAVLAVGCHLIFIESGNHGNTFVVLIAVEHLLAEREERLRRHIVIFQHDTLIHNRESPFLGEILRWIASLILGLIRSVHLTLPINILI